jgi:hypothetical protein
MRSYISFFVLLIIGFSSAAQTADNGLTANSGNIQLGGTLNRTTSIDQNSFGLHLWSGNNQIFTTLANGNVGIGTTTPWARLSFLDVHLTEEPIGIGWYNGGYGGDATRYGIHRTAGPWVGPDYAQLRLGWLTGIVLDPGTDHGKSYVDVQGNGLRVTSGNIGIGTTNAGTSSLTIERSSFSGSANVPLITVKNTNTVLPAGNGYNMAGAEYYAGNETVLGQCISNYGVGINTPFNSGSGFYITTRTEHPIIFATGTASTEKVRIGANGNFLIGTTTDNGYKLQVKDNAALTGATGSIGSTLFLGDVAKPNAFAIHSYGDNSGADRYTVICHNMLEGGSGYATDKQGGGVFFDDRASILPIRFMFKQAGNSGTTQAGGVSANGNLVLGAANDDNGNKLQVTGNTWVSGKLQVGTSSYNDLTPYTPEIWDTYNTRFNGGNVSIFAPGEQSITGNSYQLNFYARYHDGGKGDVTSKASFIKGTVTTYRESEPQPWEGRGTLVLGSTNTTYMPAAGFTDVPAMYLYNGKVGVGVTVPESQLHTNGTVRFAGLTNDNAKDRVVVSDANGNLSYRDASTLGGSATAGWSLTGNNDANAKLGTIGSNDLPIITGNVEQMRIGANGNVGIGTTAISGNYKLSVEGTIRTRKVRVDPGTWADYVFESDYKLLPLKEVEQYIQQEKHLPEVPTAAEVKKEGLDVGDNQALLLKKIEELTLYVIQQQKQLEAQQQKIETLEKKVNGKK